MTATKYVIEVCPEDGVFEQSQWAIQQAIRTALKTLGHKKHKIGKVLVLTVEPVQGSLAHAIDMVQAIKKETEDAARRAVDYHEDESEHHSHYYDDYR